MKTKTIIARNEKAFYNVSKVLQQLLNSQEKGDLEKFSECFSHEESIVNIGTDLDEFWQGWFPFFQWMSKAIPEKKGLIITEKDTTINISKSGEIAWYSQLIDTCLETKGESQILEGFRHSGVMENHNGKWHIVQSHISIPYSNMPPEDRSND